MISLPPPKGKVKACKLPENTGHDREEGEVKHFLLDIDLPAVFCSFIVCKNGFPQCELHDATLAQCRKLRDHRSKGDCCSVLL